MRENTGKFSVNKIIFLKYIIPSIVRYIYHIEQIGWNHNSVTFLEKLSTPIGSSKHGTFI